MGAEYTYRVQCVIALSVITVATSAPFVAEVNISNKSTSRGSNRWESDTAARKLGTTTTADRQMSPAYSDNAMQTIQGRTKHLSVDRRRLKRAALLSEPSGTYAREKAHRIRVGEAKLSQRFPPHVDDYEHFNNWDDWQQEQEQQQRSRELAASGTATMGRMRSPKTAARSAKDENDDGAGRERQETWPEEYDLVKQRSVREFDSIDGGLVVPDVRRREFDSLAGEIPVKRRRQSYHDSTKDIPVRRREFDSIDGGLIVPDKRGYFDSFAGEIPAKKRLQSYRDSADGKLVIPDVLSEFDTVDSGTLVPNKHRPEFDSLAGEIPSVKRRQPFAGHRNVAADTLAPAAAAAAAIVGRGGTNVGLAQLTAVRRDTFDSLGGGLIPAKRRMGRTFVTDDEDVLDRILQERPVETVDDEWNEIETDSDAAARAMARRDFDSLGGGLVLTI